MRIRRDPRNGTELGFEAKFWAAADALCISVVAVEYKHVILGLIFLTFSSDVFRCDRA